MNCEGDLMDENEIINEIYLRIIALIKNKLVIKTDYTLMPLYLSPPKPDHYNIKRLDKPKHFIIQQEPIMIEVSETKVYNIDKNEIEDLYEVKLYYENRVITMLIDKNYNIIGFMVCVICL